ncbi:MAG TPA: AzlD domain-containing protein [Xanthobacteraceae bacterium]|jgi:hypothetical protein|nr:AzlD domain-containing protein [Xanthobacteraceae bacterium]
MPGADWIWAYAVLVLVGFLPNEIWRMLGIIVARGLDEDAEIIIWVRAIATAVLAGVIAKIVFFPPGVLASVPLPIRLAAFGIGFVSYLVIKRSVLAGVVAGEIALMIGASFFGA